MTTLNLWRGRIVLLLFLFTFLAALINLKPIFAAEQTNLSKPFITPGSFYFPVKRTVERAFLYLHLDPKSKFNYSLILLQERMKELNYVAENQVLSQLETTSNRFYTQAGDTVGIISANRLKVNKETVSNTFKDYQRLLEKLRDKYPYNSSYWLLLQQDREYLEIYVKEIK